MRSSQQQLIHMVNQIVENNQYAGAEKAAQITSTHMQKFWARSMKEDIKQYLDSDGSELCDTAKIAISLLSPSS
jgi:formate dehydrogenase subunit delta